MRLTASNGVPSGYEINDKIDQAYSHAQALILSTLYLFIVAEEQGSD